MTQAVVGARPVEQISTETVRTGTVQQADAGMQAHRTPSAHRHAIPHIHAVHPLHHARATNVIGPIQVHLIGQLQQNFQKQIAMMPMTMIAMVILMKLTSIV